MYPILQTINTPRDLKKLSLAEMTKLAEEIRQFLLASVSQHGGHLAANLGVVELTMALHFVFNCPEDKLIWDVGHQSYVHKILTGRKAEIESLRQFQGISGFPKISESMYDAFGTGHSSTSVSAALGMALTRDLQTANYSVVSVIGDGALTGGMAFEALNHAGHTATNLTVILNDNAMSIAPNVGAMSGYLNRLRSAPSYHRTKEKIEDKINRIPVIGSNLVKVIEKFKNTIRYFMVPGSLFEELGFTYIGPINGHRIEDLVTVLNNAKAIPGPVLIHVVTEKGHGYHPAALQPEVFHGIGPFDVSTGKAVAAKVDSSFTQCFGDELVGIARKRPEVVAITAAMESGTGLTKFAHEFPNRFFDVGICEQHAVTMAAGMAINGYRPVVCLYSSFLQRAYDQIIHDVALQNLPVVFAIDRAGLVGEDGPTHHGIFDLSFLRDIPNMSLLSPQSGRELQSMLETALTLNGPVAIRYPKAETEEKDLSVGWQSEMLLQNGNTLAILTTGRMSKLGQEAGDLFSSQGQLRPTLVHIAQIKPLPQEFILSLAARHSHIITLEDNVVSGGFGTAVLECLADHDIQPKIMRLGIPDQFVEHGSIPELMQILGLTPGGICENVFERWPELFPARQVFFGR